MQTRFRLPVLILIATVLFASSCSKKTNKQGRYVPKTASAVFLINGESMSSKLPWEEIRQNKIFIDIQKEHGLDSNMMAVFQNPENTGVDIKKNLLFFVQKDSVGGYIALEGSVKDGAKFKDFNSKLNKGVASIEKNGINYFTSNKMTTSWDKEKFVIVIDLPGGMAGMPRRYDDSSNMAVPQVKRDIMTTVANIYSLSEDASLAKDEKFSELVGTKGDIHVWVSVGSLTAGNKEMAAMSMLNMSKLYDDSYYTAVGNFENGRIDVDIKSYSGKELSDLYKKYGGTTVNMDMIKRIPSKDVTALFAMSFKPEGLKELIKLTGLEGFVNLGAAEFGFTLDDFIKANKGDILFSVSDIKKDSNGAPKMNALFSTTIGDKNAFAKLIEAGKKLEKTMRADKFVSYNLNDNYFVLGTEKPSIDKFLSTPNNNNYGFLDKASNSSSLFYLNIPLLMGSFKNELSRDSLDNISYQTTINTWENVIATSGGFKNGGITQHIEINLIDKNTNSLKQLNKYIDVMSDLEKQKQKKREEWFNNMPSDTTTVAAPVEETH